MFPKFSALLPNAEPENVLPVRLPDELTELEQSLGVPLPVSYKLFLQTCGGLWLLGGNVQMGSQHPFIHDFQKFEDLTAQQKSVVRQRGGMWPPPSHGMLCFAEYFLEADGDQVLFDISRGLTDGEYPVYYYAHEESPARVTHVAGSFGEWIENNCVQSFEESEGES
ncbi:MAG: SMI1/KNR4 family protein [Woeseiaceae bacterium]